MAPKPWPLSNATPAVIVVREHLYFTHPKEGGSIQRWVHRELRRLSCKKFNKALAAFQRNSPERELSDMHLFAYTFKVLARSATRRKMTDKQRTAVGDDFVRAMPEVVARCAEQPQLRYKETLPDNLRAIL